MTSPIAVLPARFHAEVKLLLAASFTAGFVTAHSAAAFDTTALRNGTHSAEATSTTPVPHVLLPKRPHAGSSIATVSNDCAAAPKARRSSPSYNSGCMNHTDSSRAERVQATAATPGADVTAMSED